MTVKSQFYSPFSTIESREHAHSLRLYSVVAFLLWSLVLLLQVGLIGAEGEEFAAANGSSLALAMIVAIACIVAAIILWRKPNLILPAFGLGLFIYEFMSLMTGMVLGAPMAMQGAPAWTGGLAAGVLVLGILLQATAVRGLLWLSRQAGSRDKLS